MLESIGNVGPYIPQSTQIAHAISGVVLVNAEHPPTQITTFYSPSTVTVDPISHIAIFEQRDPETGKVTNQYPSERVVDEYRKLSQGKSTPASIAAANALGGKIPASALPSPEPTPTAASQASTFTPTSNVPQPPQSAPTAPPQSVVIANTVIDAAISKAPTKDAQPMSSITEDA